MCPSTDGREVVFFGGLSPQDTGHPVVWVAHLQGCSPTFSVRAVRASVVAAPGAPCVSREMTWQLMASDVVMTRRQMSW